MEGFNDLRRLACMFLGCQVQEQNLIGVAQGNLNLVPQACKPSALRLTYHSFIDTFTTTFPIDGFNEIRRPAYMHVWGGVGWSGTEIEIVVVFGGWKILSPACHPSVLSLPYLSFINPFSALFLYRVIQ